MAEPLIINNWQQGIADSAHLGPGLMRNVEIESFPGAIKPQKKPSSLFHTSTSATFTANAGTDILTTTDNISAIITDTAVQVSTTGTLPSPLAASTNYFSILLSSTTLQLATSIANAGLGNYINITDAGSGVHTLATLNPGTINYMVKDPRTDVMFAHDSNGRVWYDDSGLYKLLSGNTLTSSAGNGLAISSFSSATSTWLFVFRNATVDVIDVFGTSNLETPVWNTGWLALNSGAGTGNPHHAINGQDNIIYFVDSRYVGSIKENSGSTFDPTSGATYTATNNALDLPVREIGWWLEELGINLMVAGGTFNFIYPWDRVSSSYNLPLPVPETSIKRMKNIGNLLYILAGSSGRIYTSQGTYVKEFKKIPYQVSNNAGTITSSAVTWGGISQRSGALIFGASSVSGSNSGVYLLQPDGTLTIDTIPSSGSTNATAIYASSEFYTYGYSGGIDNFQGNRYASFEAVVQSALYRVADKTQKATFSTLEIQIAKPVAGHVRISYRTDASSAFTTMDGGSFVTDVNNTSYESDIGLIDIENIQVQAEMDGNVELMEIRLIP